MTGPATRPRFDAPSYLDWEAEQPEKHEYLDGKVFAMAGASEDARVGSVGTAEVPGPLVWPPSSSLFDR